MGIEALTHREDGTRVRIPQSPEDWRQWVSAGRTRNWIMDDPLIDWLRLYGESKGYKPAKETKNYDSDLDFLDFILEQGNEFEAGILRVLQGMHETVTVAEDRNDILNLKKAEETFAAMARGAPIIYQAVLWDAEHLTYGSPDFLVRSDILRALFPDDRDITESEASIPAPALPKSSWHYRVVDTKFTTLRLNAAGTELSNEGSQEAYKGQLYIYNRMLGRLQELEPPVSYVLGRGWQIGAGSKATRGSNALQRLGVVPQDGNVANRVPIADEVRDALEWIRRVRMEGAGWDLLPTPTVPELYPNMGNSDDGDMMTTGAPSELEPGFEGEESEIDWELVKKWLADELKELTQLYYVGVPKRKAAHNNGIYRWDDPRVTVDALTVSGRTIKPRLERILAVNADGGPAVLPARVEASRNEWYDTPKVEFYVDFEYCNDLNDDFTQLPEKGGKPIIFMIGCGHVENGEWQFHQFTTDRLTEKEEIGVIREWVDHMASVRVHLNPDNAQPRVFHWSPAEVTNLENAYNSARVRHGEDADWPTLGWYDFLTKVIREEPVTVQGALGFGLKAIAKAMHSHGFIETDWPDNQVDGLGAMVGAWRCDARAQQHGISIREVPLMDDIARYNEVDCKVMMEIMRHLRAKH